jgi:hypothetical protein
MQGAAHERMVVSDDDAYRGVQGERLHPKF